nr:EOG090X0KMN [Ceriodaphnia reticulata]
MENYIKGKNIEFQIELSDLPFKNIPPDIVWMKVKPASKMTTHIDYAIKSFEENQIQLWTGIGPAIGKTISCIEIIKRRIPNLHQITKVAYHKCEEHWVPKLDGLDSLKVVRNIPVIHILLSTELLDSNEPGYQHSQMVLTKELAPLSVNMKQKKFMQKKTYVKHK